MATATPSATETAHTASGASVWRRNVLVVGATHAEFSRVAPFLRRGTFEVDRFPGATSALELIGRVPFEVLLVKFPLQGIEPETFFAAIRREGGPCRHAPLLLLAAGADAEEASRWVGRGANRVLSLDDGESTVQSAVSRLLRVAPRRAARLVVRLEVKLGGAKDVSLCQTENVSTTGMLVLTQAEREKGDRMRFEFMLDHRPIAGVAEVVRRATMARDRVQGLGLQFVSFIGDSQLRFERHLDRLVER